MQSSVQMDALSSAASVIAVIQLTGSLLKLCGGYIQEVKDAREEMFTLQQAIAGLQGTLQDLHNLQSDDGKLPTSSRLVSNIINCLSDLRTLETRLVLGKGKNMMRKVGLRALKWPLKRAEVEGVIQNLERYKSSFLLSLQVDQTSLMLGVTQNTDRINRNIDLGKLEGTIEAGFESFSDRDEVQCLQGTRTELLRQIVEWAISPSQKSIFWLRGMAGTGKSTISRTVAKSFKDTNHLGASFFFKRGEGDRGNARKFFPTLTRQLMLRIFELRPAVQKALDHDPDIASKSLREQFEKLLLTPLLSLDQHGGQPQIAVIVIDALDECEHDQDVRNIIRLLPLLQKAKGVRLPIFLTSRPELPISLGFSEIAHHEYQDLALHEIPEEVTEHDIHLFLQDRFAKIRHDRNISQVWPGDDVIQELVKTSVPLFISAATVCRYIENSKLEPTTRLTELLKNSRRYATKMEKTYLPILTRLLEDQDDEESEQLVQLFHEIIGVIILLAIPLSVNALSQFLHTRVGAINNLLNSFRSVFNIPGNQDMPLRILHLSFRDFLINFKSKFHVDEQQTHMSIAENCLITMRGGLKRNICDLSSYGTQRKEIDAQVIRQHLPSQLQYSCRFWAYHLLQCKDRNATTKNALAFLQKHLLHWIEAMSIIGLASEVVLVLDQLRSIFRVSIYEIILCDSNLLIEKGEISELSDFLRESKRFFLSNRQIADNFPLQIYHAGLLFAPRMALMRSQFKDELPDWIRILSDVQESWSAELQALEGHSGWVLSVAFSPDGQLLASCSKDKTVRLWDTATGALRQTFGGHSGSVHSVAFSPDGQLLASCSKDKTVRLWDTATGALRQTFGGHLGSVDSVAFSPDGQLLASSSIDMTIRIWGTLTGARHQTLKGHSGWVRSVTFSPDGLLLASSSEDKTIRLWDTATSSLKQTLEGHSHWVLSVAFSPDGRLLASSSEDKTLRIWVIATGVPWQTLEGHSGPVYSVAFSPDGRLLASCSSDLTVRLWDTATGTLQQTLKGHSSSVSSVGFSPDSQLLASSSIDMTVRIWGTATGARQYTIKGHSSLVSSVAFSPDSLLLASSSEDNTIRLWDPATGVLKQTLEGHSHWVLSVAFSPNGRLLASCSRDLTVRLWDTATGAPQQTLAGHEHWVRSIAFSPDGGLLASSSDDTTIRLWDPATGTLQQTLNGHSGPLCSVAFSPDGRLLASSSVDKTVRIWDTTTGALQQTFEVKEELTVLGFSRGSYLHTSLGYLNIEASCDTADPSPTTAETTMSLVEDQWVTLQHEKVLWLPPHYRPHCSAVKGNTLAMGHASGRVSIIQFVPNSYQ